MSTPIRTYAGATAESRVAIRRRRLIEAAFVLMADDAWLSVSISQLCREAGLNKRYFYESFVDLTDVESAVLDDLTAQLVVLGLGAARAGQKDGRAPAKVARDAMAVVVDFLVSDRRRAKILFGLGGGSPRAAMHRAATLRVLARQIAVYGHEFHGAKRRQPIADVSATLLVGGTIEVVSSWLDGEIAMTVDELVDHLAGLWVVVSEGTVGMTRSR